jgi:hypothetical protein
MKIISHEKHEVHEEREITKKTPNRDVPAVNITRKRQGDPNIDSLVKGIFLLRANQYSLARLGVLGILALNFS